LQVQISKNMPNSCRCYSGFRGIKALGRQGLTFSFGLWSLVFGLFTLVSGMELVTNTGI
jgi:hypothetical protein